MRSVFLALIKKILYNQHEFYVSIYESDRQVKLEFFNTCAELPDAEPDKLFDRFYRGDKARTQKNGGYGIGLSVARSIVEANRGTIDAEFIDGGVMFQEIKNRTELKNFGAILLWQKLLYYTQSNSIVLPRSNE